MLREVPTLSVSPRRYRSIANVSLYTLVVSADLDSTSNSRGKECCLDGNDSRYLQF